jgi:hypothetical protein
VVDTYLVPVRNELTTEVRVVEVVCCHPADAQVEALSRVFHELGWRKSRALDPYLNSDEASA